MSLISPSPKKLPDSALANGVAMRSIMSADRVFTMVDAYVSFLSSRYPDQRFQFVEQDLYPDVAYQAVDPDSYTILALGYWGTYKRLESLLQAFDLVRQDLPQARLLIAGRSSPQTPSYLDDFRRQYAQELHNVTFLGYVHDQDLPSRYLSSSVVCLTNYTCPGVSAVFRLAANFGRPVIAPAIRDFRALELDGWGVVTYEPGNVEHLANHLLSLLACPPAMEQLGYRNFTRVRQTSDHFCSAHLQIFKELNQKAMCTSTSTRKYNINGLSPTCDEGNESAS